MQGAAEALGELVRGHNHSFHYVVVGKLESVFLSSVARWMNILVRLLQRILGARGPACVMKLLNWHELIFIRFVDHKNGRIRLIWQQSLNKQVKLLF